jgi:predicted DNA repair protein MutK
VIALNEVTDEPFVSRAVILVAVALGITALVYGVVAVIVKMDDVGLHLATRGTRAVRAFGRFLVRAMPALLTTIATVGVAAMLWVGGHIVLVGLDDLGWHDPYDAVHHLQHKVEHAVGGAAAVLGWLTNTLASAVLGIIVGATAVLVMHLVPGRRPAPAH